MLSRYPATHAEILFSDQAKINLWIHYSVEAMISLEPDSKVPLEEWRSGMLNSGLITPEALKTAELRTGHDVVAFLELMEIHLPMIYHRLLHYGMTSSDLVENSHHQTLRAHSHYLLAIWGSLERQVNNQRNRHAGVTRPGRTHGQLAEPTTWDHQLSAWLIGCINVKRSLELLTDSLDVVKSFGPTGMSLLRDDYLPGAVPSTQVINRDLQLNWATVYLRAVCQLDSLATLIRCGARSEVGELREAQRKLQVGSSAMPLKTNPIRCEQINGLARVARGLFASIAETTGTLWDDRDISNSSVERLAVVDLAHLTEYMTGSMTEIIINLQVDEDQMQMHAKDLGAWRSVFQGAAQHVLEIGPVQANKFIGEIIKDEPLPDWWPSKIYKAIEQQYDPDRANRWLRAYAHVWDQVFDETPLPPF